MAKAKLNKVTSLHLHKNKIESRRKRELARDITHVVGAMVKENDIRAFAFIGISATGQAFASWDTGDIMPMWAFPDAIGAILKKDVQEGGVEDGWRASL